MEKLKQRVSDVVLYKKNIEVLDTKVKVLMDKKTEVQSLLYNRENEIDIEDKVQQWVLETSEILKKASGMAGKKSRLCGTCCDPTYLLEVGEILRNVDKMLKEIEGLDLSSYTFGLSYCRNLESREKMLREILEALTDTHVKVIGVYGMVGVGKTILIEELARRAQTSQLFDAIVIVQFSSFSDVKHIQTQVANKIDLQLSEDDDEETRAQLLHDALKEKVTGSKILVILDDVQSVIDLRKVGIPYGPEHEGASCGVVFISRIVDVCRKMGAEKQFLVECLTLEEAMILFRERLGDKIENMEIADKKYQYMENAFLVKCRGLPLVINSLARSLRSMSWSKWETIADEIESHTLIEVDEVKMAAHAIFRSCNLFIQNQEKRKLFLLCCLIQQGADIPLEKLFRYGIGLGLFEVDLSEVGSFSSVVSQTHSWVHELKSLSLLMEGKKPQHVMMHDFIQDVAISTLSQDRSSFPKGIACEGS